MQPSQFTNRVETSALLSRLQAFLPEMKKANEELSKDIEKEGSERFSIEATGEEQEKIEMNVTVGILEEQTEESSLKLPGMNEKKCKMDVKLREYEEDVEDEDDEEVTITSAEQLRELGYVPHGDVSVVEMDAKKEVKSDEKKVLIQVLDE